MTSRGKPLYSLRTAAQLVGLSPRTLRGYEEAGLVEPARTGGNQQRLYSEQDIQWFRCVRDMIHDEGLTVTAIRRLLDLIPCWQIRHCDSATALACAPHLNIPNVACEAPQPVSQGDKEAPADAETPLSDESSLEIKVIYGVEELGAVMQCSRCISAERTARRVALSYPGQVTVRKLPIDAPETRAYGALTPPAVIVGNEVVSEGQGVSEKRLDQIVQRHLEGLT